MMKLVLICFVLVISVIPVGCGGNSPTLTETPPPPVIGTSETPVANPTTTTTPTTTPVEDPVTATTTPAEESGIVVTANTADITFPDYITFGIDLSAPAIVEEITIVYSSDQRTLAPSINQAEAEFDADLAVSTEWKWEMKKTGSIPPGATIWWEWVITDENDETYTTPRQEMVYSDTRYEWEFRDFDTVDVYWHDQPEALIDELLVAVESHLSRLELDVNIPPERKPRVFIYRSSEELRDAMLFEQEWVGAVAFTSYNIILTAVSTSSLDWAKDALPHEITHLLVKEVVFGPFGDLPLWLDEGLAQYTESEMDSHSRGILDDAIAEGTLISLTSLSGSFPTDPTSAYLAYAESLSIVEFIISEYGWEKMRQLLDTFKGGSTNDKALLAVYGFDVAGLESQWKAYIGTD